MKPRSTPGPAGRGLALATLVTALALTAVGCSGRPHAVTVAARTVPLDGSACEPLLPPDADAGRYRLVISGVFTCSADGRERDAFYAIAREGEAAEEHGLLRLSPPTLTLVDTDIARHRYTYQVPATAEASGEPWSVSLDVERLAAQVGVRPEELPATLAGGLTAELVDPRPGPVSTREALDRYWPCWVCLGPVCLLVVLAGAIAMLQSRRDVSRRLTRIDRACRSAKLAASDLGAAGPERAAAVEALRRAAYRTVAFIEQTRLAESGQTEASLEREAARLEARKAAARAESERVALDESLAANRAAREALRTLAARREHAFGHLAEAESLLRALAAPTEDDEVEGASAGARALAERLEREYPLPGIGDDETPDPNGSRRIPPDGETPIDS